MIDRIDLTEQEARAAMDEIMTGRHTDAQIAGFLTALRMKGETAQELIGFASVMRKRRNRYGTASLAVLDTAEPAATAPAPSTFRPPLLLSPRAPAFESQNMEIDRQAADVAAQMLWKHSASTFKCRFSGLRRAIKEVGIGFFSRSGSTPR